jgi:glycosyltransferase family 2
MQVSIIIPYYNAAKYIKETVSAIIAQTYKDWELIIVNDCSSAPETVEVLKQVIALDNRIKVLHAEKNGGAGWARNIGIETAQGRYIGFCDSDDWWYPTKLEEQLKFMQENGYELTCTWYEDTNEKLEPYYTMKQASKQSYKSMMAGCNIGTPGVLFDTKRIGKKYMPLLRRAEDWGLWMNILKEVDYIYTYPKALWKYRHIPGSETSNKWVMLKAVVEMYQTVLGINLLKAYFMGIFVFLPNNMLKKLKKVI